MTSDLCPGDQVVIISPRVSRRGPWPVQQVDENGLIWLKQTTAGGHARVEVYNRRLLAKIDPEMDRVYAVRQALRAHVPPNQRCQICKERPGSESHFFTVPIPEAFTRLCVEDRAAIVQRIRKAVAAIVIDVFDEFKAEQHKR